MRKYIEKQWKSNTCFFFCLLFIMSQPTSANPIPEDSAKVKAEKIFKYKVNAFGRQFAKKTSIPKVSCVARSLFSENEEPTYYIFNLEGSAGFAIIAGDDCMPEIIGYSLENSINPDDMPEALTVWLREYDQHVKDIRRKGGTIYNYCAPTLEVGVPIIEPFIKTQWNQYAPYNWLTPIDEKTGKHTPTGCVPTAVAQIVNYYKWPNHGYMRDYNWENICKSYGSGYSDAEGMAVATLMRDLGATMGTEYTPDGSATSEFGVNDVFGYNCKEISYSALKETLANGPIYAGSKTPYSTRHAYIIDGLDSNGLYHVNFGWGGNCDGYYDIREEFGNKRLIHMEPDYDCEKTVVTLAAFDGVSTNAKRLKVGDKVTVTLHNPNLKSGENYNGSFALFIYSAIEDGGFGIGERVSYNPGYTYQGQDSKKSWNSEFGGNDIDLELTLWKLPKNGSYKIMPVVFYARILDWIPFFHFADGTLVEDIPFEYKDGEFIFKDVPHGNYDINISKVVTASTYMEGGRSNILAFVENKGGNTFVGKATAKLVNKDNANDVRSIDMDLYIPANQSKRVILNTKFDYTGTFSIKELEVWNTTRSGEHITYYKGDVNGAELNILPQNSQEITTDFHGIMNVEIVWKNDIFYVNDSIYKFEEANADFYAYSLDADTANVEIELWAVPLESGLPSLIKKKTCLIKPKTSGKWIIGGSTASLSPGTYYLMAFGRCGNNTNIFPKPEDLIGEEYQDLYDKIPDNIIHVFDPGVDVPMLKLHSLRQVNDLYYRNYGYVEAVIENISDVDYYGYTSSCLSDGNDSYMSVSSTPFRIKAKQTATIWPQLYQYNDHDGTGGYVEGHFTYKVNNGVRDLTIPMEGDFSVNFTEMPENIISASSDIAFYYKDNLSIKPSLGFYSKGTLKRSLWKNNEIIMIFDDLQTDSTYNTYKVCPETAEIKDLPSGNYLLKINLTDINGEHPTIIYPLVIDDKGLPLTIENVSFDTNKSFSYEGDIPIVVTIKNPTQQYISTLVSTKIERRVDGENRWWVDSRELHAVTLPALQSTTINLNAHILPDQQHRADREVFSGTAVPSADGLYRLLPDAYADRYRLVA